MSETMKAMVYLGPGKKEVLERPKPTPQNSKAAVVKMLKTTICGTDLHILKGDTPEVEEGRVLGHEGIGIVESVGENVSNFKVGDKVIMLLHVEHAIIAKRVFMLTVMMAAGF